MAVDASARIVTPAAALLACLLFAGTNADAAPAPRNAAGKVELAEGTVVIERPDHSRVAPKVGDTVSEGDSVATGPDGELHLTMQDGGYLAVRPNTKMQVTRFQATGEAGDTSVLGLLEGGLRVVTGWIGKYNASAYQVRTSIATVGLRGTDHETQLRLASDADGEASLYSKVYEGATFISSSGGARVDVAAGDRVGFSPANPAQRPRLLDRTPRFFRGSRHERLFEGRHARIQAAIGQLREARETRRQDRQESRGERREKARDARDDRRKRGDPD